LLADGITPFALSALKYGLFALLFLFIWRSMRWVVRGLNVDPGPPRLSRSGKAPAAPAAPPGPTSVLIYEKEKGKPRSVKVAASMVMGRGAECELLLDDTFVSQQHARLFGKNGSWYVEDLGSTNGTYVNEQRLAAPAMVQPGDRIRVGQTVLELRR
jgi:FHA domain-containing protein